ncbi:MAG: hypothetical protein OEM41_05165 [Ignavibacteria bacterium]|nr:hypothetical protein [Ignavibacteria bacterium]
MDFMLWATRSLHLFAVIVWIGGLMYQAVVTFPVATASHEQFAEHTRHHVRRFIPFIWMSVWTILVTGVGLMLFNPRFVWFSFRDGWSIVLGAKQIVFVLMTLFSLGFVRMFSRLDDVLSRGGDSSAIIGYYERMTQFARINVGLALLALLLASALR